MKSILPSRNSRVHNFEKDEKKMTPTPQRLSQESPISSLESLPHFTLGTPTWKLSLKNFCWLHIGFDSRILGLALFKYPTSYKLGPQSMRK